MRDRPEPVAVVGMACRFPGGPDLGSYWQLLTEGRQAIIEIPPDRWNLEALRRFNDGEPLPYNATHGGWLPRVRDFDDAYFRMSPREARTLDPKQRLALEVVAEAFEDANLAPGQLRGRHDVGIFLGTAQSEYLMRFYNRMEVAGKRADRYSGPGNDASFSSGRISAFFGLEGPSVNVNTACSTSLVAVHQAIRAIQAGECDVAAAGGVSIIESPEHSLVMDRFHVLSPDARCKAFDADADGYVRGEGCGIVVLRRLSDALANGDRIYAVLRGSAVNANGPSDNLMAPNAAAQSRLLRKALAEADVDPATVDYVEAHGTGTKVGDPIEIQALAEQFADAHRAAGTKLHVASVKTNIGHLEVTAGIAGLIKAVLCIHHGRIPAHLNLRRLNPAIDPTLPFVYPDRTVAWPDHGHPRRAVVNSFGISGINAAVVLEEAPAPRPEVPTAPPRPQTILPLSAVGEVPLRELARRYADRLETAELVDVAFTAATGRDAHATRLVVVTGSREEATEALRAFADGREHPAVRTAETRSGRPRIAWLFTGQGAQYVGMGRALAAHEPVFREALERVDAALRPHLGRSVAAVMWGDDTSVDLTHTAWTQPALFAFEVALAELWRSFEVEPDVLIGHSIGEIAAAHVAGVLSLDDAAALVAARGRLMGELPAGGAMAAVFADVDAVRDVLRGFDGVDVAADNGPRATVISGRAEDVDAVCRHLDARGVGSKRLTVSHAFHSRLMEPMLAPFREVVAGLSLRPPRIPVLSNLTGTLAGADMASPDYWVRHVREPVRFREGILGLAEQGVGVLLEIGPKPTLIGMGRRCRPGWEARWVGSTDEERPHETLVDAVATLWLAGALERWSGWWAHHRGRRVDLPRYPFQRREHWVEDPGPPVGAGQPAAATHASTAARTFDRADFYRNRWMPCDVPEGTPLPRGTVIVGLDGQGVGARVASALEAAGHTVVRVVAATDEGVRPDGTVALDPVRPEGFRALVARHAADLRAWVHTWSLDVPEDDEAAPGWWTAQQDRASVASLHVAQALVGGAPHAAMFTVTLGAEAVRPGEAPRLGQAGPWGVARVVALEHRALRNVRVDLDPAGGGEDRLTALVAAPPVREDQLAVRRGVFHALRLVPHTPTGTAFTSVPGGAWVITGGLGALGLAVAEWLAGHGVTHLVLCGRRAPRPEAEAAIARMRAAGAHVRVEAIDVADRQQVERLFADLDRSTPVRGVVHAAGVLADGPVLSQDVRRFREVFPAKVEGAWNLHLATRHRDLDAFVLFSSVTSTLGAPGQVNYAAANAFLDALAWWRHARGLPAVAVNWGPWGEIGMAARLGELMASRGMGGVPTAAGVEAFGRVAMDLVPQVAFMDIRVHRLLERDPAFADAPLVRELVRLAKGTPAAPRPVATSAPVAAAAPVAAPAPAPVAAPAVPPAPPAGIRARLAAAPAGERAALLLAELARWSEELLGFRPGELDPTRPLAWQGFDSVMAIDLHRRITDETGADLPLDRVVGGPRLTEVVELLLPAIDLTDVPVPQAAPAPAPVAAPPADPRAVLLERLTRWSEELLGFQPGELDPTRPLAWQGFDSVMAIDLHRRITDETGADLPLDRVVGGPRLTEIVDLLLPIVDPARLTTVVPAPTPVSPAAPAPAPVPRSREAVLAALLAEAEELLGFRPGELDPARPLAWQGFDSVMAIDLHRRIRDRWAVEVPLDRLVHGPRVEDVVDELLARLPAVAVDEAPVPAVSTAAPVVTTSPPPTSSTRTPAPPPPAPTAAALAASTGRSWLWIAILLAVMAGGTWYLLDDASDDGGPRIEKQAKQRRRAQRP